MKKMKKYFIISLMAAIATTILTPLGVFVFLYGLAYESLALLFLGVILLLHGVYGIWFYWIWFAKCVRRYRVARAIDGGMHSASEISKNLHVNRDNVNKDIRYCMKKGAFPNMFFDGNNVRELNIEK